RRAGNGIPTERPTWRNGPARHRVREPSIQLWRRCRPSCKGNRCPAFVSRTGWYRYPGTGVSFPRKPAGVGVALLVRVETLVVRNAALLGQMRGQRNEAE